MNSESVPNRCPQCGGTVPPDAPQGLCPRCVLARAATPTETGAKSGSRLTPPPMEAVAAAFPQFEILELIGIGGMGVVYKARQPKLDRVVALKLLPQSHGADPAFAERFHREARVLARLTHPHIVSVFDFGESGGFCYLLMEFVDGVNLRQAMQAGRFSPAQALAIVPDICSALQYAHDQGVLHRDIKPENILLDGQGRVKIADFGIAKLVGDPSDPQTGLTLTQSGARLGTPHYMAPEQIEKPSEVDHRADIYSLGVVFYELLTGELPLGRFAAPSAKTPLDARVDEIVMRALAKERELRQQSAGEMKTQVETVAANPQAPAADPAASAIQAAHDAQEAARSAAASWSANYEYKSPRTLFGRPLVHVAYGRDPATGQVRVARGIIAMGQKAVGVIAIGGYARGLFAFGGVAIGGIAFGGLALGFFAFAGLALGLVSVGGLSIGLLLALGGGALGLCAGGGLAIGKFAAGGLAIGQLVWDARRHDEAAHWIFALFQGPQFPIAIMAFSIAAGVIPSVIAGWVQWHRIRRTAPGMHHDPILNPPPNPWPHRLFWLVLGLILLPVAAVIAALVGPLLLGPGLGGAGRLLAGIIPMAAGAFLVVGFLRTRPKAAQAQPRAAWNPWPQRFFWTVLLVVVTPILLLVAGMIIPSLAVFRQSLPKPPVEASNAATNRSVQLIRMERTATDSQVRLRWELRSTAPAEVLLASDRHSKVVPLKRSGGGDYSTTVAVLFERQGDDVRLTVQGGDETEGGIFFINHQGNPDQILAKANEFVAGDLPLKFNTPVWLAFFGTEQVTLEIRGQTPATQASVQKLASPDTAAATFSKGDAEITVQELQFAQNRLAELKKQAEVGMVAPQGTEVLDAEVAVAEAEGKLRGDPRLAAIVRLKRAAILFSSARKLEAVGSATHADVEQARLEQMKVRSAFTETIGRDTTNLAELKWLPAWNHYLDEEAKIRTGRTSPAQFILASRDLNVSEAELLHQPLWAAQVHVEYRQGMLKIKRLELSAGQVSQAEVDSAELLLKQAEDERRAVEKANPPAAAVPPAENGKTKPLLGQDGKFSWLPGQPLLSTEAGPAKGDSPQRAASPEPAKAPVEYSGVVRFFGDVNGKIELLAGHPTWLSEAVLDLHPSQFADLRKVTVQRADGTSVVVDVHRVVNDNHREQDLELRDGDRVKVPQRIL